MEATSHVLSTANEIYARSDPNTPKERPPAYKAVGISLAIASGAFIGTSFVLKKIGLLKANVKYNEEAGEGYGYLKNAYWWTGMTLMIMGEILNFVAYAFVDAILVTPLGALSVVITTVLSAIFLKERLSFVGKVGCFMCVIGSVVIVMNAPRNSSVNSIQDMQHFVLAPGFLTYAGVVIVACLFIALWVGPRYGKKSVLVYLSICSLIGGLSVVATQGLGAAIVTQAGGTAQFNQWFIYVLLVFVISTLVTEIIFLNKALNLFNAALVTPTYYVFFTSSTIITSAILFRGFKGTPTSIITVVMGFLQICSGVVLLQLSKSAKDVPDAAVFSGDLDQVRTVAEQEQPESEPKADAIRGAAAIIRRLSNSRQMKEVAEAKRIHEERLKDQMEPIGENERVEWDGLKRRKTLINSPRRGLERRKTLHPPLGMAYFPDEDGEDQNSRPDSSQNEHRKFSGGFMNSFRRSSPSTISRGQSTSHGLRNSNARSPLHPVTLSEISLPPYQNNDTPIIEKFAPHPDETMEMSHVHGTSQDPSHIGGDGATDHGRLSPEYNRKPIKWADQDDLRPSSSLAPTPPPHTAKRQFSFQNVFRRKSDARPESSTGRPTSRLGLGSRHGSRERIKPGRKSGTEEERLGLVTGDSNSTLPLPGYTSEDEDWGFAERHKDPPPPPATSPPPIPEEEKDPDDSDDYAIERQKWIDSGISPARRGPRPPSHEQDESDEDEDEGRSKEMGGRPGGAFI